MPAGNKTLQLAAHLLRRIAYSLGFKEERVGVREETLQALVNGQTPGQISKQRGVNLATTLGYLNQMVGEGKLRRSDILFTIPHDVRKAIAAANGKCPKGTDPGDYRVVQLYGDAAHAFGDMYDDLREIETVLHDFIKLHLQVQLGHDERGWWRGIPERIRASCHKKREEDAEPAAEAYCYTELLDIASIIEDNWSAFQACMPAEYRSNRKQLLQDFRRLNGIRRMVMHPVRGDAPSESDFEFVRNFKAAISSTVTGILASLNEKLISLQNDVLSKPS
jgi:hypothetical protein